MRRALEPFILLARWANKVVGLLLVPPFFSEEERTSGVEQNKSGDLGGYYGLRAGSRRGVGSLFGG